MTTTMLHVTGVFARFHRHRRLVPPCSASGWPVRPSLEACPVCNQPVRCVCDAPGLAHVPRHPALPATVVKGTAGD